LHNHNSHPTHPRTDGNEAQVEEMIVEAKEKLDRTLIPESENGCLHMVANGKANFYCGRISKLVPR